MTRTAQLALLIQLCAAGVAIATDTPDALRFTEVAGALGIDFVHQRAAVPRLWFPEIMSGGGGWLDFDGDGDLDLYLVQGGELDPASDPGPGDRLYRNDGNAFVDVTALAVGGPSAYGMGLAVGDYDGDGDPDIYVTRVGPNTLLRNEGDGSFTDVTLAAAVGHPGWGTSAAFLDYDGDRRLDLFVVNYIHWKPGNEIECFSGGRQRDYCHPSNYNAPAADVLYRNRGDGSFEEVTGPVGMSAHFGNGLGVAPEDFDGDGRTDLYVANDGMANQLWLRRGDRFVNEALLAGCALNRAGAAEAGMGVVAADLDNDTRPDIFVTHLRDETNTLYLNRGGWFDDLTAGQGLSAPSIGRTGFGAGAADFDHDGRLDLLVVNGRVGRGESPIDAADPFAEPNQLFRGQAEGGFVETRVEGVGELVETSRAAAFGDYDSDGDVDVAVVNNNGPARVLRNDGATGAWLRVEARSSTGGSTPGVRIEATVEADVLMRRTEPAYSYCSSNDPTAHFGLAGAVRLDRLEALWPDGGRQRWLALPTSRRLAIYR